jgi:hypothetical protein
VTWHPAFDVRAKARTLHNAGRVAARLKPCPFKAAKKANAGPSTPLRFAQDDSSLLIAQDDSPWLIAQDDGNF